MQFKQDFLKNTSLISTSSTKFKACKIQINKINLFSQAEEDNDYIFEENIENFKNSSAQKSKQNKKPDISINARILKPKNQIAKHNEQLAKSLMDQLFYPNINKKTVQNEINFKQLDQKKEQQQQDLTELWNIVQKDNQSLLQKQKQQQKNKQVELQNRVGVDDSDSSCQLSEQQLARWMKKCQQQKQQKVDIPRHSNRNNCIYHMDSNRNSKQINQRSSQKHKQNQEDNQQKGYQDWGQWAEVVQFLSKQTKNQDDKQDKKQNQDQAKDFVAIDSRCDLQEQYKPQKMDQKFLEYQLQQNIYKKFKSTYGPWIYDLEFYEILKNYSIRLIHQLNLGFDVTDKQKLTEQNLKAIYNSSKSIRKINWEISEQKKPQIRKLRSKRNCKMNSIQYCKNFYIFDHRKFALQPITQGMHIYFGARVYGNFYQYSNKENLNNKELKQLKQYLYLPSNGQCLLQTVHSWMNNPLDQKQIKSFKVCLSLTGQTIAVCQRKTINQQKDKKQIIEVKQYDSFEKSQLHYLGIVESKTSNFGGQWYCDTIIYIPRTNIYSNKVNKNEWSKFKIQIRLSQLGTIVAQLGIFDAQSSVTNCILFGQSRFSQVMMGTLLQNVQEIDYILRIAGISPLMAFITVLSRKIFVFS